MAIDLLKPPPQYKLDRAVICTYSLDLETLLALPLAVIAHAEGGVDALLADPLLVLEALREAGERIDVFTDESAIAVPRTERPLYALLESIVHTVKAPNGGSFHPKVWLARFTKPGAEPLMRVAVLSRNLTYNRSWDLALVSEATPAGRSTVGASRDLAQLIRSLPGLCTDPLPKAVISALDRMAAEAAKTKFPSPDGFEGPVKFTALGLGGRKRSPWKPRPDGSGLLAISPFANRTALDTLAGITRGERILIARQESLDAIAEIVLDQWNCFTLSDAAFDELEDGGRPSGLHAKAIAIEHGWEVDWFIGSANLTAAAFTGNNVEMMAQLTGRKHGKQGAGIEQFLDSGFEKLRLPYERQELDEPDSTVVEARKSLEEARAKILSADLTVECEKDEDGWQWSLKGKPFLLEGIDAVHWPISVDESRAQPLILPSRRPLPASHLTAFVGFRLDSPVKGVDSVGLVRKLPSEGMPDDRLIKVLRALIDSPERLLQFLRALLGGLDALLAWSEENPANGEWRDMVTGFDGEALLEDLLATASREPKRLEPVRKILIELRESEDGKKIVPDSLMAVWEAVDVAVRRAEKK